MSRFNTGNPIGSADGKDLSDNAKNLDVLMLSQTDVSFPDRLGVERKTWHGIEQQAQIDVEAAVEAATQEAEQYRDESIDARDDAVAAASAIGPIKFYETYAQATADAGSLSQDDLIEIARDETREEHRTRYRFDDAALKFFLDLSPIGRGLIDAPRWYQKHLMDVNLHNDAGGGEIYSGASRAIQGVVILDVAGVPNVFLTQRPVGTVSNGEDERCRIVRCELREDGTMTPVLEYSQLINIGHGEALGGYVDGTGQVWLWSSQSTTGGFYDADARKGASRIQWIGSATSDAQVTSYQMFGKLGTQHIFSNSVSASAGLSQDGNHILLVAGDAVERDSSTVYVYERAAIEATGGDALAVMPVVMFHITPPQSNSAGRVGVAADESGIYIVFGTAPLLYHGAQIYDWAGTLLKEVEFDDARGNYTEAQLLGADGVVPVLFELEGAALYKGRLHFICMEGWRTPGDVVSWTDGFNYACIANSPAGATPYERAYWVRTALPATSGAFNYATSYVRGSTITKYRKSLYALSGRELLGYSQANGRFKSNAPPFEMHTGRNNFNALTYGYPGQLRFLGWNEVTNSFKRTMEYTNDGELRFWDTSTNGEYNKYGTLRAKYREGAAFVSLQAYFGDEPTGARTVWFGGSDAEFPGGIKELTAGSTSAVVREVDALGAHMMRNLGTVDAVLKLRKVGATGEVLKLQTSATGTTYASLAISNANFQVVAKNGTDLCLSNSADDSATYTPRWRVRATDNAFTPSSDAAYNLGSGGLRVNNSYFAVAPTVSSDARLKQQKRSLTEAEKAAATEIRRLACIYKLNDAVGVKGESARWHAGVMAQDVVEALKRHGLDWTVYGFIGYDEWPDEFEDHDAVYRDSEVLDADGKPIQILVSDAWREKIRDAGYRYSVRYQELDWFLKAAKL